MQTIDISVIIPTAGRNEAGLLRALDSIANQDQGRFSAEVVVIPNGDLSGRAVAAIEEWAGSHPDVCVRIFPNQVPGAGRARNIGLATTRGTFITFLDDDDVLEPNYLRAGLETAFAADGHTLVALPLREFNADGTPVTWSPLQQRLRMLSRSPMPAADSPWFLGFNASKIIPRDVATAFRFPEHLRSGEDVAYFLQFLTIDDLKVIRAEASDRASDRAAYRRYLSGNSVSRQEMSYDFNVTQRLACVSAMRSTPVAPVNERARTSQVDAQYNFVLEYLKQNPQSARDIVADLAAHGLYDFPWREAPDTVPDTLVISYCFPPFADPAGYVAAKQIARGKDLVDVISADMSAVRSIDESSRLIASDLIREHSVIVGTPSFGFWPTIAKFGHEAFLHALRLNSSGYRQLRSRALWSGSHVAAALYKKRFPQTVWTAEFSDPMRFGVTGEERLGALTPGRVTRALKSMLRKYPELSRKVSTHFDLVEFVTMVNADELVFTNAHQRQMMLADYPEEIRAVVVGKSTIAPQPQPLPSHVALGTAADVFAESGVTHVAYFGSFYSSRGLGEIFSALGVVSEDVRARIRLHIFTSKPGVVALEARRLGLTQTVAAHSELKYLDFLATAAHADVLLVSDAETADHFAENPFLPSKFSDYLGVGVPIWAHVEEGSTLSELPMEYRSEIKDSESIREVLSRVGEAADNHCFNSDAAHG